MNNLMLVFDYIDLPPEFFSETTGKPFTHCQLCGAELLHEGTQYVIEKAFKRQHRTGKNNLIFEYALCIDCLQETQNELSKESTERIEMYFELYVDLEKRRDKILALDDKYNLKHWIGSCLLSQTVVEQVDEYQIYGQFEGNYLLFTYLPYMLSGKVLDELQELLSQKTRDIIDDFRKKITPPPPPYHHDIVSSKRRLVFI